MIDAADEDVPIERRVAVADVVVRVGGGALTIRQREVLQRGARNGIETIAGNDVSRERLVRHGVVDDDGCAGAAAQIGEVSVPVQQRGHRREHGLARQLARPLPRSEEECLSLANRPTERSTELIEVDRRFRLREEILRVERVVAEGFEDRAVEPVAPRARGHHDDAARRVAELRGVVVGDDLELLHRVDRQRRQLLRPCQADGVAGVAAVEDEVLVARAAAGDGKDRIVLRRARPHVDHDDAGRERDER